MIDLKFAKKILNKDYYKYVEMVYNRMLFIAQPDGTLAPTPESEAKFIRTIEVDNKAHWAKLHPKKKIITQQSLL